MSSLRDAVPQEILDGEDPKPAEEEVVETPGSDEEPAGDEPAEPSGVEKLLQEMNQNMLAMTERVNSLEEKWSKPAPTDDGEDPEALPPQNWKALRQEFRETINQSWQEIQKSQAEEARLAAEQEQKEQAEIDEALDTQVNELRKSKFLPPIKDADDPNDPGKAAERELYAYAYSVGTPNLVAVSKTLKRMHDVGYYFDIKAGDFLKRDTPHPGTTVPVAGRSAVTPSSGPNYGAVRNLSMSQIAERFMAGELDA